MCIYHTYSHVTYIYLYANIICFQDIGTFTMSFGFNPSPAQAALGLGSSTFEGEPVYGDIDDSSWDYG